MPTCRLCRGEKTRPLWQVADYSEYTVHLCESCGVRFLSPQPSDEFLERLYSKSYYDAWGLGEEGGAVRDMKISTFALRLELIKRYKRSGKILDVGCATGFFLEAARDAGFETFGVELSSYSSAIAKQKLGSQAVFQGILEDAPFPAGSFDVIVMSDLLEHVRDPRSVLEKTRELLREDGILMVMTPDTASLTHLLMKKKWVHYKVEHLFYFDADSLRRTASPHGLAIVYREAARKTLNLAYFYHQFNCYRHWLLTPICRCLHALLPDRMLQANFNITAGDMVVVLQKSDGRQGAATR